MNLIVQKFGGSSVRDAQRLRNVAAIIADARQKGNSLIVVLSAQGNTTDELLKKARELSEHPSRRELDALLATGEQVSVALCAILLEEMEIPAISLTAWQVGIHTGDTHGDARITSVLPVFRGLTVSEILPRWDGVDRTQARWLLRPVLTLSGVRFTQMWMVSILPTPV